MKIAENCLCYCSKQPSVCLGQEGWMLYMIIGIVVGIVLAVLLVAARRAQPVLLPMLLVLGIAGLSFAVQWQKEHDRMARNAAEAERSDRDVATIAREPLAPPVQPPVVVPLSSPLQRPPSGAAAPPAVPPPPSRTGNPS
jgi:uncharacterized membrane protein